MRRSLYALGTMLAAMALTLAGSTVASASADGPTLCNPTGGSCGNFLNNGDVIQVHDTACDSRAAVVRVYVPTAGIADNIFNHLGCGTVANYSYGDGLPENQTVYYQPCIGTATGAVDLSTCTSGWTHGTS